MLNKAHGAVMKEPASRKVAKSRESSALFGVTHVLRGVLIRITLQATHGRLQILGRWLCINGRRFQPLMP